MLSAVALLLLFGIEDPSARIRTQPPPCSPSTAPGTVCRWPAPSLTVELRGTDGTTRRAVVILERLPGDDALEFAEIDAAVTYVLRQPDALCMGPWVSWSGMLGAVSDCFPPRREDAP